MSKKFINSQSRRAQIKKTVKPNQVLPKRLDFNQPMSSVLPTKRMFLEDESAISSKQVKSKSVFSNSELNSEGEEDLSPQP